MAKNFVMALDEGTTSARAIIFDKFGKTSRSGRKNSPRSIQSPVGSSMTPR
jgi:glycerol kinase